MTRLKILDFDSECRPLTYLGGDWTTGETTVIAWAWVGNRMQGNPLLPQEVECFWLTKRQSSAKRMLRLFLEAYNEADMVTGHYLIGHDLPVLNGSLLDAGLPPLPDKLVQDTKVHLTSRKHISASQESLAAMLGCRAPKLHMTQQDWRRANRLTPDGIELAKDRCIGDVLQHMEMREKLIELGWLRPPKMWRGGGKEGPYTP